MAYSLLYVSKTLLTFPADEGEITAIVQGSRARNTLLNVTGALIATGGCFAQVLEGDQVAVAELMRSIDADPRHMRVKIIRIVEEPRRFANWSMAYSGQASFVDRHIIPLFSPLSGGGTAHLAVRLIELMEEFVRLPQIH